MNRCFASLITLCAAATAFFWTSCSPESTENYEKLEAAEQLIDTWQLDSAASLMSEIKPAQLTRKADSALFALNYVRIQKMNGNILGSDSIARFATDFYDSSGNNHRAMLAWYYRACSQFDNRHYPEAMISASRMKTFAEQESDYLYLARFGDIMAHCAELVGNNVSAAEYYSYSFRQFMDNAPDEISYLNFFFQLARNAWLKVGRLDSALNLSHAIKPIILAQGDTNTVSKWISNHATMLLNNRVKDYAGAKALYREMDSIGAPYWPGAINHRIARLLISALADGDSAAWNQATSMIYQYGNTDVAFGYFFYDASSEEMLGSHSPDLLIDSNEYMFGLDQTPTDVEAASPPYPAWKGVLIGGAIAIVLIGFVYRRIRRHND